MTAEQPGTQPPPPPGAPTPPGLGASREEWRAWRRHQRSEWSGGWPGPWAWHGGFWSWWWGAALILIGAWSLLQNLGLLRWLRGDILWPSLLIVLGVVILVGRGRGRGWRR